MARRSLGPGEPVRVPAPYADLIDSPAYSPTWGKGWLAYDILGDTTRFWFVPEDLSCRFDIDYDEIYQYDDRWNCHLWIAYHRTGPLPETLAFLLHPPEDAVVLPMPHKLRRFVED